jgi:CDP-diacylglycerol--glycerol-3-phosphate 3-phosphatidyltransferase
MPGWVNLPNLFTALRVALTPVVVWGIVARRPALALVAFAAAAFTDYLDGAAARGMKLGTQVGAVFDPIADKCLLSSIFVALAAAGRMPWWMVWIVLGRDLFILLGAAVLVSATRIRKFPPSWWGKISTCVQISTVIVWMAASLWNFPVLEWLERAGLWICPGVTIWSGIHYTWRAAKTVSTSSVVNVDGLGARE